MRTSHWVIAVLTLAYVVKPVSADAHVWIDRGLTSASQSDPNANEGSAVAIQEDVLVVGATELDKPVGWEDGHPTVAVPDAGGVQIYRRNGNSWALAQTIFSPTPVTGARFGAAVAIDGDVIVVGEPNYSPPEDPVTFHHNGRALVYTRSASDSNFVYRKEIYQFGLNHAGQPPHFGAAVDVVGGPNGHFAVAIGAPGDDVADQDVWGTTGLVTDEGSVFVVRFRLTQNGGLIDQDDAVNSWYVRAPVASYNPTACPQEDDPCIAAFPENRFSGSSLAITRADCSSSDCQDIYYLAMGAPGADVLYQFGGGVNSFNTRVDGGAVWIYRIDSTFMHATDPHDVVQQWRAIEASVEGYPAEYIPFLVPHFSLESRFDNELFGNSVDIKYEGGQAVVVVGTPGSVIGNARPGAVYYFKGVSGYWHPVQKIRAPDPVDGNDAFGAAVAFAGDRLTVGAPQRENPIDGQIATGSIFDIKPTGTPQSPWNVTDELFDADHPLSGYTLTPRLAASENWIAVGIPAANGVKLWQRGWTLNVEPYGQGATVQIRPAILQTPAIMCPPDCELTFEHGRHLTPVAIPGDGFSFLNWLNNDGDTADACENETSSTCHLVMDRDQTIVANFVVNVGNTRILNLAIGGGDGAINVESQDGPDLSCPDACDGIYPAGSWISVIAVPTDGFEFDAWSGACENSAGNACSFQLNAHTNLTASFRPVNGNHMITVNFWDSGSGTVKVLSTEEPYVCGTEDATCSVSRPANSSVELHACTKPLSEFVGWGGSTCWGADECIFTLDEDKNVDAVFAPSDILFKNSFEETTCDIGEF